MYFEFVIGVAETALIGALLTVLAQTVLAPSRAPPGRPRARAGNAMMAVALLIFFGSGVTKLLHLPFAVAEMKLLGLTGWMYNLVAGVELISGALFAVRPLRSIALLFVAAHCGGAICAHLIASQYFAMVPSAMVLTLASLGAFLRHPQMLWSLRDFGEAHPMGTVLPWSRAAGA